MRHLPKREYTASDQRADSAFLVGVNFGIQKERARILDIVENSSLLPSNIQYLLEAINANSQ